MRNKKIIQAFGFLFLVVILLLSINSLITFTGKVITSNQDVQSNFMLDSFRVQEVNSLGQTNLLEGNTAYSPLNSFSDINKVDLISEQDFLQDKSKDTSLNYSGFIIELKEEPAVKKKFELEELAKKNQEIIDTAPIYSPARVLNLISGVDEKNLDSFISSAQQRQISEKEKVKQEVVNLIQEKINQGKNPLTGNAISNPSQINLEEIIVAEFQDLFNGFAIDVDEETAREIAEIDGVKRVWPNMIVQATLMESVPLIQGGISESQEDSEGNYYNVIQGGIPAGQLDSEGNDCLISGKECLTGKGVKIAIIDTGVDYTHPDLGACTQEQFLSGNCEKVIGGYDFVTCEEWGSKSGGCSITQEEDNNPIDEMGHGTHCASIAAGNGVLKGVAPEAEILAYRVLNSQGGGMMDWVIAGIEQAVKDNADILSLSLGSSRGNPDDPPSKAIDNAVLAGKIAVVAAGNDGFSIRTIGSPGSSRKAITVGSSDKSVFLSSFSSR
ncbi:MAG TPA: S8 family serine peptidase, partial [Candidatus Pacearchaeota archaeon]|nr:S8 family serine peptidase [Candidatus Pacearchaeota archaeon]